jgi:signal transduction histidine kinase/FixJ family two-component response regulator
VRGWKRQCKSFSLKRDWSVVARAHGGMRAKSRVRNSAQARGDFATRAGEKNKTTLKFWDRKRRTKEVGRGVAQLALDGASGMEIAGEALRELHADGIADRVGIWLAHESERGNGEPATRGAAGQDAQQATNGISPVRSPECAWRGVVWDRESESTPPEWQQLSCEAPLPDELVFAGRSVEQRLGDGQLLLISVLMELRKVLWVPIGVRGRLQGVILCGARDAGVTLPLLHAQRVAAELALHLLREEERGVARERYADLALTRLVHAQLESGDTLELALARLADSVVTAESAGIGAAFASIGILPGNADARWTKEIPHSAVEFRWKSGDADCLRMAEGAAVSETWQEALRQRRSVGAALQAMRMHTTIARIVAVPIEAEGKLFGVLLAGLYRRGASLGSLERLEYRAALAGLLLARRARERAMTRTAERHKARLAGTRERLLLVDERGCLAELSAAAAELLAAGHAQPEAAGMLPRPSAGGIKRAVPAAAGDATCGEQAANGAGRPVHRFEPLDALAGGRLESLFRAEDRRAVADWRSRETDARVQHRNALEGTLHAELRNGVKVRLSAGLPSSQGLTVINLVEQHGPTTVVDVVNNEQALQGVIEWLEEGVVLFDANENVRAHNTRFEQLLGLGPLDSAKGETLEGLIARMGGQSADPARFSERWRELANIEGGTRDELRVTNPSARLLERTARPVFDAVGRKLGRVEVYRDLTAQRMFQSQLLQTEKLAALGQMVSGVAHELSNPLTSILGYAQRMLLRGDAAGKSPEVRQIFQEAERAAGVVRQLLFSARETPPERRRVALNQVVLRSMELQRFSMATEKISLELDLDPGLPVVLGDAAQLQQVLMNLVGNARQAIQQKGAGGRIRVRTLQAAERRVQLAVEDDGPGVPQSILARIFDPFFTTKAEGVGTGLGLSIVLSIVREHGGAVNVQNAAQGGAVFTVELPVAEGLSLTPPWPAGSFQRALHLDAAVDASAAAAKYVTVPDLDEASPAPADEARQRSPLSGRVLVVEDEPTVARLIADVLHDEGLVVEVLLDGREGLRRIAERRFDLVICDMRMPGLDGQQFYRQLAKSGSALQYRFLFVTGDVIAPATQAFLEQNHLPHLAKPFRVEELTERVREVLQPNAVAAAQGGGTSKNAARKSAVSKA